MKYSLKYYASLNPLNSIIAENMVDVQLLNEGFGSFEDKACNIFSKAYGICRDIINNSPVEIWKIPDYFKSAGSGYLGKDIDKIMGGITFSVVIIILDHFDENWKAENKKFMDKMLDYLKNIHITGDTIRVGSTEIVNPLGGETACIKAHNILRRGTDFEYVILFEEFSIQGPNVSGEEKPLNREEQIHFIEETVKAAIEKYKDKNVEKDDIPNEDVRKMWKQALSYAKAEIEAKIPHVEYDAQNESLTISDETNYLELKPWEEVKDMIKSSVKEYLDEEIEASDDDIDEIFDEVYGKDFMDKVNKELSEKEVIEKADDVKETEVQNQDKDLQAIINRLEKENADLRETIEIFQQRMVIMKKKKKHRGGIAMGLTPEQSIIFGKALFKKLGVSFKNQKNMAPYLNALFGWGTSSLAGKMGIASNEDKKYVASIFGRCCPEFAKEISEKWNESVLPPWEDPESAQQ